jgi:tetratricopeptide (TPR) repeat protein
MVRLLVVLLLLLGLPTVVAGQDVAERDLLTDAADGRLDRYDLLDAALVAGGVGEPERRAAYRGQFDRWVAELTVSGRVVGTTFDRARAIHEFLHARGLGGGFCETCTTLDVAFDHGRFNCISSVILYRCLAARFGLRVRGVEVPGHAYAVVESNEGSIVVQTTCPGWFTVIGDERLRRETLRRTLGEAAVGADRGPSEGRSLDDVALVAIVYYNRGLDHLEAGRFAESLAANRTAMRLDPRNGAARANLLATLNNWSLARYEQGDVAEAVRMLEHGLSIAPDYALFRENLEAVRRILPRTQ